VPSRSRDVGERVKAKGGTMRVIVTRSAIVAGAFAAAIASAGDPDEHASDPARAYCVTNLASLGGTNSKGNSVNDRGWVAGYSNLPGNQSRHAALWVRDGLQDLGTLGGPNSNVAWPVKNTNGLVTGISQTATPEPLGENWSCSAFFSPATATGFVCLGFAWDGHEMTPLPTLGGNNGFATDSNDRGQIVGWAENTVHDPTCVPPQVLQFKAVVWEKGFRARELPLPSGDTSSAATAINSRGQVVGISGRCDQAVGRFTAIHALLWDRGQPTDIGNLGRLSWNTPMAINEAGDVVGFAPIEDSDPDNPQLHAFLWTRRAGIQDLGTLNGDLFSEALGINAQRQVVGLSCQNADGSGVCRAFLWKEGVMTDLNSLVQPGYADLLTVAGDINDAGVITGRASDAVTGGRVAFRATPARD
jgi:probable HAF family extracellular repeat protein